MSRGEIIAANPIVEFVRGRGHDLERAGKNFVTDGCPVSNHKKRGHRPVTLYPETQSWNCHDCKRGGSVIDWVMIEQNVSVADAMRMLGHERNTSELRSNGSTERPKRRLIDETYDYTDESGKLLFQCVRFSPKHFSQRRPNGSGGWIWNLEGVPRVLYRLPQVISAQTICVAEGEKDCDCLGSLGFTATTNPLGAGKWRNEYSETLRGKDVYVFGDVGDEDGAGERHTTQVLESLSGKAKSLKHVTLPDGFHDVSDFIASLPPDTAADSLCKLIAAMPEWRPQTREIELGKQLDSICAFVRRYIVFQMPEQAWAIALWVAHCWVVEAFEFTPYLHINSPEKQCAKTRLLDLLGLLVVKAWRAILPSEPVLFRKIESDRPTLLLDEADGIFTSNGKDERREALRSLLNTGFERGAKVPRCVGQGSNYQVQEFAVFCAKALAGIGRLPDTISDRSVPIQLVRRSRDEKVERFRKREAENEASAIRAELEAWAQPDIIDKLREARPSLPDALSDRQQDICEPLLAIADMAGGDWPERARAALVALCSQTDDNQSLGVKLLSDIREVFDSAKCDKISTLELLKGLVDLETDAPWASWWEVDLNNHNTRGPAQKLARLLKPYKIVARGIRLPDDSTPRGYRREDFLEAWKRYLPANGLNNATTQHSDEPSL